MGVRAFGSRLSRVSSTGWCVVVVDSPRHPSSDDYVKLLSYEWHDTVGAHTSDGDHWRLEIWAVALVP